MNAYEFSKFYQNCLSPKISIRFKERQQIDLFVLLNQWKDIHNLFCITLQIESFDQRIQKTT